MKALVCTRNRATCRIRITYCRPYASSRNQNTLLIVFNNGKSTYPAAFQPPTLRYLQQSLLTSFHKYFRTIDNGIEECFVSSWSSNSGSVTSDLNITVDKIKQNHVTCHHLEDIRPTTINLNQRRGSMIQKLQSVGIYGHEAASLQFHLHRLGIAVLWASIAVVKFLWSRANY